MFLRIPSSSSRDARPGAVAVHLDRRGRASAFDRAGVRHCVLGEEVLNGWGDFAVVMDDGRIVHRDSMGSLARDTATQTRLLGLSLEAHG